ADHPPLCKRSRSLRARFDAFPETAHFLRGSPEMLWLALQHRPEDRIDFQKARCVERTRGALMTRMISVLLTALLTALRGDGEIDRDLAGLFEFQRYRHGLAFLVRLLRLDEHEVITTGLQLNGFACRNFETAFKLAHLHH